MPEPLTPGRVDLETIQAESQQQALPQQEKVFRVAPRVRAKLHNLPDPTNPPLGFVPGRGYDTVFPFIKLPHLAPNLNGDWVQFGSPDLEPNRLYYGDNLQVLRTIPSNSIDLIYIDPPFFSGAEYNVIWGDTNEVRTFSDIWDGGLPTYLVWLNARLWEMRRVLKETGSIYVHCDWHASHYIKTEMDKIFGYENFVNEIVWWYYNKLQGNIGRFPSNHDIILCYSKSGSFKFKIVREGRAEPKKQQRRVWDAETASLKQKRDDEGNLEYYMVTDRVVDDVWRLPYLMPADKIERIGYPTQKPLEVVQRIIEAATEPGDVVADFFCGGGAAVAAAQGLRATRDDQGRKRLVLAGVPRRWIACDSSRVAVSVTLNRLVNLGEELSGVKSNYGATGTVQHRLDLPETKAAIPDIRVNYVGVYPIDRFKAVEQAEFERFIVACLAAQLDNSEDPISGWRSAREPLRVGPADPDRAPDAKDVQAFFEAVVKKHLQPNVRTVARYVCWRTSPELTAYKRRLTEYVRRNIQPRGADLDFDFLLIDSEEFRERIRQKYPDADDNEFLLRFTKEPVVGEIAATRSGPRTYKFEARDADSTNAGGYLVNCQWDFDYQRGHFGADSAYVLGRRELKGAEANAAGHKFEAVLAAEHTFTESGARTIACRVQDNFGAEAIRTLTLEVS